MRNRNVVLSAAGAETPVYVEDVFSTYLYTGTGATQTITNGIDLATKGGLVWTKGRSTNRFNVLADTARGALKHLSTNTTDAQFVETNQGITAFNSNGFTVTYGANYGYETNLSGTTYASWTFRKQKKFFDIVTWTGDSNSNRQISHNLTTTPGMIIIKNITNPRSWFVWHRSLSAGYNLTLNTTDAAEYIGADVSASSSTFTLGGVVNRTNISGDNYIAYLFAHDAGGFGLSGSDSIISCGSYTGGTDGTTFVNLGWEPQYVLLKRASSGSGWAIIDNMRSFPVPGSTGDIARVIANASDAEVSGGNNGAKISATGFYPWGNSGGDWNADGGTYIYMAIRRGPMKVPTDATKVFSPIATSASVGTDITTNFAVDTQIFYGRSASYDLNGAIFDRIRGVASNTTSQLSPYLLTINTNAETTTPPNGNPTTKFWNNKGYQIATWMSGISSVYWNFLRAPNFFDVVCYSGTGSTRTVNHNLAVTPELILIKARNNSVQQWAVYSSAIGATKYLVFSNSQQAVTSSNWWSNTSPTSTLFTVGSGAGVNNSSLNYIAYLFATCPGVSKVGSYTGTGTTKQIDCGFTNGARFVLIKRTDDLGDWYIWDTARGIVSGNDPYILMEPNNYAETTNTDYIDPYSAGFELSSTAPAAINANGGTYIYLAIA